MTVIKSDEYKPTHKQVVQRIAKWYKSRHQSCIVMAELVAAIREIPDVIVWTSGARSTLIECKASRADFLSDKDKYFRRQEEYGVGDRRYYAAPMGIIQPEDLPAGWGLIELTKRQIIEVIPPTAKTADKRNECIMLMSALRRLEISTAVYVVHDSDEYVTSPRKCAHAKDCPNAEHKCYTNEEWCDCWEPSGYTSKQEGLENETLDS